MTADDWIDDEALREALRSHSAGDSPGFLLLHATLRWQREVGSALSALDLTYPQFGILGSTWWLGRDGEPPYQRQVAEHSGMGEVMTSQLVQKLERKGLIERQASPHDARAKVLALTERGRELAEKGVATADRAERRFFGELSDEKALLEMLRVLSRRRVDTGGPGEDAS